MKLRIALLAALALTGSVPAQQDYPTLSPFDGLRWSGDMPQVKVGDTWYELLSLNDVETAKVLEFCRKRFGDIAHKRFREDLVQVLTEMKHPPKDNTARLLLREVATGKRLFKTVQMTHERRQRLRRQARAGEDIPDGGARRTFRRRHYPRLSPFDGLRYEEGLPEVRVNDRWYHLVSFDGIDANEIFAFCKQRHGQRWQKSFAEDLVEVLAGMGYQAGRTADLKLRDLATGKVVELTKVEMSNAKRDAIRDAGPWNAGLVLAPRRTLTAAEAAADLDHLARLIRERYSYRAMNGIDWEKAVAGARENLGTSVSVEEIGRHVMRILARFGDGHTRVQGSGLYLQPGHTPFALVPHGERIAVLTSEADALLDPEHPYLHAVDGVPVTRWLKAVAGVVTDGAPQLELLQAARRLQSIQFARAELGHETRKRIVVELADAGGRSTEKIELEVARARPGRRRYRPRGYEVLDGRVGYLRIPEMDSGEAFRTWLERAMKSFRRRTKGLVIDVRGNGGGSREALRTLLPHFLSEGEPARAANVAAARIRAGARPGEPRGYLANRYLYPARWPGWSDAARRAIAKLAKAFRPDWRLPEGEFSAWHYMVVERGDAFRYGRPVIVLMDAGCFSATDIFLGGFKGVRNVTLMGEPSGGGSGRSLSYRLPNSGISFRLSSMASFLRDGQRYDGKGIAPDVLVRPTLDDLTGKTDSVLEKAIARLR